MRLRKHTLLIPFVFFLVNILLRSLGIEVNSLAGDEPYSVYFAQMNISDILRHMRPGNNPPLYEFFLHFWIRLFGIEEVVVRIPSLIFTAVTASFMYKIGNEFFSKPAGIVTGLLFTFSNYGTYFSHEARVYSLFGMLTCISFYFFLRWLNGRYSKRTLSFYVLVNALLLYAHYFGTMVVGLQVGLAVLLCFREPQKLKDFGVSLLITILVFAPYIPVVWTQFTKTKTDGTWLQAPNGWPTIQYMLIQFANSQKIVYLVLVILGVAVIRNAKRISAISKNTWVILAWFIVPFFGMFFLSYKIPMFHNRYLMHAFIGFILLIGIASVSGSRFRLLNVILPVILIGVFAFKSKRNIDNGRHSKEAVAKVQELRDSNTRVVMYPKYRILGYSYYFNRERFKKFDAEFGFYKVLEGFKEENFYGINQYSEARIDSTVNKVIFMMTDGGPKDQLLADFKKDFVLKKTHHYPEIIDVFEFARE